MRPLSIPVMVAMYKLVADLIGAGKDPDEALEEAEAWAADAELLQERGDQSYPHEEQENGE